MNADDSHETRSRWRRCSDDLVNPEAHPELEAALAQYRTDVPVLWLLGKTGAGKSSVIQRLTGDSRVRVGNGFEPCTRTADLYDHPAQAPVVRFLDTRGLGEAGYNPEEDLAACQGASHALLILTRVDDTSQATVCDALKALATHAKAPPALHLHSALHTLTDTAQRQRAIDFNTRQVREALGRDIPQVIIDFLPEGDSAEDTGLMALREAIVTLLPELDNALTTRDARDNEHAAFLLNRREVLGYASAAAAIDVLPGVGIVGVPSIQGKLLHALAARYQHTWDRQAARDFLAVLGTSFLYRYGMSFIGRQAAKFIPVYGQTAGAAAAAGISFASTYALGRAACLYLYRKTSGGDIDRATLQEAFKQAFDEPQPRDRP
jgi:uncharacterized protein (DUF697 family)